MSMKPVVKKGTKLVCPLCCRVIGRVKKNLYCGDVIKPEHLEVYGKKLKEGDTLDCPYCGFPLLVEIAIVGVTGAIIHTEYGWLPNVVDDQEVMLSLINFLKENKMWKKEWDKYLEKIKKD